MRERCGASRRYASRSRGLTKVKINVKGIIKGLPADYLDGIAPAPEAKALGLVAAPNLNLGMALPFASVKGRINLDGDDAATIQRLEDGQVVRVIDPVVGSAVHCPPGQSPGCTTSSGGPRGTA
jgi:hypothetical protein